MKKVLLIFFVVFCLFCFKNNAHALNYKKGDLVEIYVNSNELLKFYVLEDNGEGIRAIYHDVLGDKIPFEPTKSGFASSGVHNALENLLEGWDHIEGYALVESNEVEVNNPIYDIGKDYWTITSDQTVSCDECYLFKMVGYEDGELKIITDSGNDEAYVRPIIIIEKKYIKFDNMDMLSSYKVIEKEKNWKEAKKYCEDIDAHLVTITSKDEQRLIEKLLDNEKYIGRSFWLGATDESEEGKWKWVTDEKFDYTNWADEQPVNLSGLDYLSLYATGVVSYTSDIYPFKWSNLQNSKSRYFICECEHFSEDHDFSEEHISKGESKDETKEETKNPDTGLKVGYSIIIFIIMISLGAYIYFRKNSRFQKHN